MPTIPPLAAELNDWVMNERCTVSDLEFYDEFNQEYRPSNWTRNAASDDELLTFVQDGTGGQYALWITPAGVEGAPVVKLGSDGEVAVMSRDLVDFAWLIACGVEPLGVGDDGKLRDPIEACPEMQAWVRTIAPDRKFGTAKQTLDAARAAYPKLVAHIRSLAATT